MNAAHFFISGRVNRLRLFDQITIPQTTPIQGTFCTTPDLLPLIGDKILAHIEGAFANVVPFFACGYDSRVQEHLPIRRQVFWRNRQIVRVLPTVQVLLESNYLRRGSPMIDESDGEVNLRFIHNVHFDAYQEPRTFGVDDGPSVQESSISTFIRDPYLLFHFENLPASHNDVDQIGSKDSQRYKNQGPFRGHWGVRMLAGFALFVCGVMLSGRWASIWGDICIALLVLGGQTIAVFGGYFLP
jgi:hypothetical protein